VSTLWEDLFGLRESPFDPGALPKPGSENLVLSELVTRPLLLHESPALRQLYCPKAGPFAEHEHKFQVRMRLSGYAPGQQSDPKRSQIFVVAGPEGTGKTTLASAMIEWLCQWTPPAGNWHIPAWPLRTFNSTASQMERLTAIGQELNELEAGGGYCCLFIDDFLPGTELQALNLFDVLTQEQKKTALMFMTPANGQSIEHLRNSRHNIIFFDLKEMNADQAVEFARQRIRDYRAKSFTCEAGFPLYPFCEEGIRESVQTPGQVNSGNVTLRLLSKAMHESLVKQAEKLLGNNTNYSVGSLACTEIERDLIDLPAAYEQEIAA
jgi:hypothetical protein